MIERCLAANFDVLALTVDTITGGNRERDLRTGFTSPPRLTLKSLLSFGLHPVWAFNYFSHEKFELPQLKDYVAEGSDVSISVGEYFSKMLDQSMNWQDAENIRKKWGRQFCLKGIMSVADARRALDIGATAIMVSNHGGRQLDGSRAPFDQLAEIVDAVGDRIDVICDGGIKRGTHVLKALSLGAKACSGGRFYLYALAAAGQVGVGGSAPIMGCAASTSTRISTSLSSDTIGASTGTSRSKPCSGSPRTISRRVTGISSGATIPAKACRQSGASRGAEEQRPECGQTDQDPKNSNPATFWI